MTRAILRSATWEPVNAGLTSTDVRALAIDPRYPSSLYAGTGTSPTTVYAGDAG